MFCQSATPPPDRRLFSVLRREAEGKEKSRENQTSLLAGSLTCGSFVESLLCEDRSEVIDMDAVAHAGVLVRRLDDGDVAVAVIVAWDRAVQHAKGFDFATVEANDLVAVLRFSSVSVVHI